jgi:hypothetical protein
MISSVTEPRPLGPLALWVVLVCLIPWSEAGGQAPNRPVSPRPTVTPPPMPTQAGSPIDFFRTLVTATPQERQKLLASKEPKLRKVLEDYALKYQALPAEQRELRLRNMELRYHVTSLLRTAPSNRTERLKFVPDRDRPLVEQRLKVYDQLTPEQREAALQNERTTRELIGVGLPRNSGNGSSLTGQASNQVVRIEQEFVRWQMLPDARHAQIQRTFKELFELTDEEQAREKLQPLPLNDGERQLMEQTLARFKQLSLSQRNTCVTNFGKFASLSPAERREFLVNAAEWQKMKPEDRQAWRNLIAKVPPLPPLPHSFRKPPLPPIVQNPRTGTTVPGTN